MAANYGNKIQTDNKHLNNLTGAKYVHIDGAKTLESPVATGTGCRLLRVINSTKGLSMILRSGSRVIGVIGTGTIEGTYGYGVYCENGLQIDIGGTGDATVVYSS